MKKHPFPRSSRLINPGHYKHVMDSPVERYSERQFVLLAGINNLPDSRIGFVLPKRRLRLAVARNRIKRVIRESFRHRCKELVGIDIVFLARDGLASLDNKALHDAFERAFSLLVRRMSDRHSEPAIPKAT